MADENKLSELVSMAHRKRAEERARFLARELGITVFIIPTKHGLNVEHIRSYAFPCWQVTPDGDVTELKPENQ